MLQCNTSVVVFCVWQKCDSPDTASSFTLVSSELQRKDKFMRVLFSCNVRKVKSFQSFCSLRATFTCSRCEQIYELLLDSHLPAGCVHGGLLLLLLPPGMTNEELCVSQINRFHKAENRAVLITDRHLYKMDPLKQYKAMKSIPLYNVRTPLCLLPRLKQT